MFSAKIISPEKTLFEGQIKAFASLNETGPFSMLEKHANFITLIKDRITIYLPDGAKQDFNIGQGVLAHKNNQIRAFVGFRPLPSLSLAASPASPPNSSPPSSSPSS